MAKIYDYGKSTPKGINATNVWVWEVVTYEWDDHSDMEVEVRKEVFFDPWKAVNFAISKYGINSGVQAAIYKYDNCHK